MMIAGIIMQNYAMLAETPQRLPLGHFAAICSTHNTSMEPVCRRSQSITDATHNAFKHVIFMELLSKCLSVGSKKFGPHKNRPKIYACTIDIFISVLFAPFL